MTFKIFKPKPANRPVSTGASRLFEKARSLDQQGKLADAVSICREILEQQPEDVESLMLLAGVLARQGDSDRAIRLYSEVIGLRSDHALAYYKRGNLLKDRDQLEESLASYGRAVALDPAYANAFCNRGVVLHRLKRPEEALASFNEAIALNPVDALSYFNRSAVLRELKRFEDALTDYDKSISLKPDYVEALYNRGILLQELKLRDAALASYNQVIEIQPGFSPAHFRCATLLRQKMQWDAALASYDRAIELNPAYYEAFCDRGLVLGELGKWHAALGSFDRAIALSPDSPELHCNRAEALLQLNQVAAAIESFDRAFILKPDCRFLLGARRHAKMNICDWHELEADMAQLTAGVEADAPVSPPLQMMALLDSPALHHKAARIWVREKYPEDRSLAAISKHPARDRIRVGYFSGDFYDHVVTTLMAELFETHDRSKYQITAFSSGPDTGDGMRKRMERAFGEFIDVRGRSDREIALLSRSMSIDIAVNLGGHTQSGRTGIFALRAAPIQINYLGYPGTMGADYMDYLIADRTVIPEANQQHFTEKIVYLPNSFLPHDSTRAISDIIFTREDLGLPSTGFVFCCFNNNYKITPSTFDSWMRILARVPGSVLFLYAKHRAVVENLKNEALLRQIDTNRLIFGSTLPPPEYLARYRAADLLLDTLPYNAGTTTIDALWAGLPVLTCAGSTFAGRMAASLLKSVGLPELTTCTRQEYEDVAVRLATNAAELAAIRRKLAQNRLTTALFDTKSFTKHLETGYTMIYERYQANLPPEHIYLESR